MSTILPKDPVRADRRGRPWSDRRQVLYGVQWILPTGAPWKDLPGRCSKYPNGASTGPELGPLRRDGASVFSHYPGAQRSRQIESEGMLHRRNFCSGGGKGRCIEPTRRGKFTKIIAIPDRHNLPVAKFTDSDSPAEVTLIPRTLQERFVADPPERPIAGEAHDGDPRDQHMRREFGTEMIAPHRQVRRLERKIQDARSLRRFRCRWKVENLFVWTYDFTSRTFPGLRSSHLLHDLTQIFMSWLLASWKEKA